MNHRIKCFACSDKSYTQQLCSLSLGINQEVLDDMNIMFPRGLMIYGKHLKNLFFKMSMEITIGVTQIHCPIYKVDGPCLCIPQQTHSKRNSSCD